MAEAPRNRFSQLTSRARKLGAFALLLALYPFFDQGRAGAFSFDTIEAFLSDGIVWRAGELDVDGVQCAAASPVQIASGPILDTIQCADNDASSIYGWTILSDAYEGGTLQFEIAFTQTGINFGAFDGDVAAQCYSSGETIGSTWGAESAIDSAGFLGFSAFQTATSGDVTPAGSCAAGDALFWRWQMDAAGTTTAVATLHILGMKLIQ